MISLDRFYKWCIQGGLSEDTAKTYSFVIKRFLNEGNNFTSTEIRDWLLEQDLNTNSIYVYHKAFRKYTKFLGIYRDINWDQIQKPKMEMRGYRAIPREKVDEMIELCDNLRDKLIIKLAYDLALRVGELIEFSLEHVNLRTGEVHLNRLKKSSNISGIPLDPDTLGMLKEYIEKTRPSGKLFDIGKHAVYHLMRRVCRKAGIPRKYGRYGIHILRHTRLTSLLEEGWDIKEVQEFAGHKSILTTQRYAKISSKRLAEKKRRLVERREKEKRREKEREI